MTQRNAFPTWRIAVLALATSLAGVGGWWVVQASDQDSSQIISASGSLTHGVFTEPLIAFGEYTAPVPVMAMAQ
jgi:hypothetical protein